jgi:hypothetical protein
MIVTLSEGELEALKDAMDNTPYEADGIVTKFTGLGKVISKNGGVCGNIRCNIIKDSLARVATIIFRYNDGAGYDVKLNNVPIPSPDNWRPE